MGLASRWTGCCWTLDLCLKKTKKEGETRHTPCPWPCWVHRPETHHKKRGGRGLQRPKKVMGAHVWHPHRVVRGKGPSQCFASVMESCPPEFWAGCP